MKHARPFESLFKAQLWPGREKGAAAEEAEAAPSFVSNCISINATTETHKKGLLTGNLNPNAQGDSFTTKNVVIERYFICILFVFKRLLQFVSNQHSRG